MDDAYYMRGSFMACLFFDRHKKAGSDDPANLLKLGERANSVSVRLRVRECKLASQPKLHSQSVSRRFLPSLTPAHWGEGAYTE